MESEVIKYLLQVAGSGGGAFIAVAIYLNGIKKTAEEAKEKIDEHIQWHLERGK